MRSPRFTTDRRCKHIPLLTFDHRLELWLRHPQPWPSTTTVYSEPRKAWLSERLRAEDFLPSMVMPISYERDSVWWDGAPKYQLCSMDAYLYQKSRLAMREGPRFDLNGRTSKPGEVIRSLKRFRQTNPWYSHEWRTSRIKGSPLSPLIVYTRISFTQPENPQQDLCALRLSDHTLQ